MAVTDKLSRPDVINPVFRSEHALLSGKPDVGTFAEPWLVESKKGSRGCRSVSVSADFRSNEEKERVKVETRGAGEDQSCLLGALT